MIFEKPKSELITGSRVKHGSANCKHFLKNMHMIKKLDDLHIYDISEGEAIHVVTQAAINAFTFVLFFAQNKGIKDLDIAIYRIGAKCIDQLIGLIDDNKIQTVNFLINDNAQRLKPEIWSRLISESNKRDSFTVWAQNNHAKIIIADDYVIEGSGNLSDNARIEQYCVIKSKQLADFHRAWIRRDK